MFSLLSPGTLYCYISGRLEGPGRKKQRNDPAREIAFEQDTIGLGRANIYPPWFGFCLSLDVKVARLVKQNQNKREITLDINIVNVENHFNLLINLLLIYLVVVGMLIFWARWGVGL